MTGKNERRTLFLVVIISIIMLIIVMYLPIKDFLPSNLPATKTPTNENVVSLKEIALYGDEWKFKVVTVRGTVSELRKVIINQGTSGEYTTYMTLLEDNGYYIQVGYDKDSVTFDKPYWNVGDKLLVEGTVFSDFPQAVEPDWRTLANDIIYVDFREGRAGNVVVVS